MSNVKSISREQFLAYFGGFHRFLQQNSRLEPSVFLTDIVLCELKNSNIFLEFYAEYGPVKVDSAEDNRCQSVTYKFTYTFDRNGKFIRKTNWCSHKGSYSYIPSYSSPPSFNFFPQVLSDSGEAIMFKAISQFINACSTLNLAIASVQVIGTGYGVDAVPFKDDDGAPIYKGSIRGTSLLRDFEDQDKFVLAFNESKKAMGEYDILLYAEDRHSLEELVVVRPK